MAKSFRFSPVKWRNPEHMPLIQLHLFTNLSPPLINLAFARQLFDFGMIATGNHNFEKFAALCNAPGGSQGCFAPGNGGRLRASPTDSEDFGDNHSTKHSIARASGRQVGDPYGTPKIFDLQQPTYYTPSVRGGAKAASPLGSPGWRPLRCNSTDNAFIYS